MKVPGWILSTYFRLDVLIRCFSFATVFYFMPLKGSNNDSSGIKIPSGFIILLWYLIYVLLMGILYTSRGYVYKPTPPTLTIEEELENND